MEKATGRYPFSNWRTHCIIAESGELPFPEKNMLENFAKMLEDVAGVKLCKTSIDYDAQSIVCKAYYSVDFNDNQIGLKIKKGCSEGLYTGLTKSKEVPEDLSERVVIELSVSPVIGSSILGTLWSYFLMEFGIRKYPVSDDELEKLADKVLNIYKAS